MTLVVVVAGRRGGRRRRRQLDADADADADATSALILTHPSEGAARRGALLRVAGAGCVRALLSSGRGVRESVFRWDGSQPR
mmetsp:Transcript_49675/g.149615  ORF Transcript_49675/g.149615 Transcript_49675/m.149615 type:complete len:82 (-) Transcript_49675:201-446(-)